MFEGDNRNKKIFLKGSGRWPRLLSCWASLGEGRNNEGEGGAGGPLSKNKLVEAISTTNYTITNTLQLRSPPQLPQQPLLTPQTPLRPLERGPHPRQLRHSPQVTSCQCYKALVLVLVSWPIHHQPVLGLPRFYPTPS